MSETFLGRNEVFWVGAQALIAFGGLLGLFFYTLETRRMRKTQDDVRRASFTPILSISAWEPKVPSEFVHDAEGNIVFGPGRKPLKMAVQNQYGIRLQISNIGQGPATAITAWQRPVTSSFKLEGSDIYPLDSRCVLAEDAAMQLARDASFDFNWELISSLSPALIVVECADVALGKHQLQVLVSPAPPGQHRLEVEGRMIHATGDSFGERLVRLMRTVYGCDATS